MPSLAFKTMRPTTRAFDPIRDGSHPSRRLVGIRLKTETQNSLVLYHSVIHYD
jgi:hypothetical protein